MTTSEVIAQEVAQLEREFEALKTRLEQDNASFSTLQQQLEELRMQRSKSGETLQLQELRLKEKQVQLASAKRREQLASYADAIESFRAARARVSEAAAGFLAALQAYDGERVGLRQILEDMRAAPEVDDERVRQVETALDEEGKALGSTWESVTRATSGRLTGEAVDANSEPTPADPDGDVATELQTRAGDRLPSRILEYVNKS